MWVRKDAVKSRRARFTGNIEIHLEFKAVIVLPTITHNYGNYLYGNYVGNTPVGKVIT